MLPFIYFDFYHLMEWIKKNLRNHLHFDLMPSKFINILTI